MGMQAAGGASQVAFTETPSIGPASVAKRGGGTAPSLLAAPGSGARMLMWPGTRQSHDRKVEPAPVPTQPQLTFYWKNKNEQWHTPRISKFQCQAR